MLAFVCMYRIFTLYSLKQIFYEDHRHQTLNGKEALDWAVLAIVAVDKILLHPLPRGLLRTLRSNGATVPADASIR